MTSLRAWSPWAAPLLFIGGCALDIMGYQSDVTEHSSLEQQNQLEDDRIQDKRPAFDDSLTVTESFDWCPVTLNKSGSVTKLSIVPYEGEQAALGATLFANRGAALSALPSGADVIPSMETVNGFMKPFNDGLYAALELGVQNGVTGAFDGKRKLLEDMLAGLLAVRSSASTGAQATLDDAAVFLGAALSLSGSAPASLPPALLSQAQSRAAAFREGQTFYSRPIGFYAWTPELESIFMQDRFLQRGPSFGDLVAIAFLLQSNDQLRQRYETVVSLYAGLTNPYVSYTVTALLPYVTSLSALEQTATLQQVFAAEHPQLPGACQDALIAFLPASRSKDTTYFNSKYCYSPSTPVNMMDELIAAIRSGSLQLSPSTDSGWYDYQLYALETLLVPEKGPETDHLLLTVAYKKKLIDTFKTIITQTRETHVKSLGMATAASASRAPVDIYPQFPVEPFPTFYLRTARAYRFLGTFLQATLGPGFLTEQRTLREDGRSSTTALMAELREMTELLYGLHAVSCRSLGMRPETYLAADELAGFDETAAVERAQYWLEGWRTNADVLADPRVIVPVADYPDGPRYWAVIGVKLLQVVAEFVPGFEPRVVHSECEVRGRLPHRYHLLVEDTVEVRGRPGSAPPTRSELRAICDATVDRVAIINALESR